MNDVSSELQLLRSASYFEFATWIDSKHTICVVQIWNWYLSYFEDLFHSCDPTMADAEKYNIALMHARLIIIGCTDVSPCSKHSFRLRGQQYWSFQNSLPVHIDWHTAGTHRTDQSLPPELVSKSPLKPKTKSNWDMPHTCVYTCNVYTHCELVVVKHSKQHTQLSFGHVLTCNVECMANQANLRQYHRNIAGQTTGLQAFHNLKNGADQQSSAGLLRCMLSQLASVRIAVPESLWSQFSALHGPGPEIPDQWNCMI